MYTLNRNTYNIRFIIFYRKNNELSFAVTNIDIKPVYLLHQLMEIKECVIKR